MNGVMNLAPNITSYPISLQFSNPIDKTGIIELIDDLCDTNDGTYPLAKKTRDVNLALDYVLALIFRCGGTWQFDDYNHTDYPIIRTNIVAGQRDYTFVADSSGNLILDIYKVVIYDSNGYGREIYPIDAQTRDNWGIIADFYNGQNTTGAPTRYDKTANGIFLDYIPNYDATGGIEVYINREGSYFNTSDTTKKPGFAGLFHEFLALRPSFQYTARNNKPNVKALQVEMMDMEEKIKAYYGNRERDIKRRLTPAREGYITNFSGRL